jgi:hypothetical protein
MSDAESKQKISLTFVLEQARSEQSPRKSSWIYSISIERTIGIPRMALGDGAKYFTCAEDGDILSLRRRAVSIYDSFVLSEHP